MDVSNICPLHVIFGAEWGGVDALRLSDPDIKPHLLYVEERAQRVLLSQGLNALLRVLMPRYRTRNAYTLQEAARRLRSQHVALIGKTTRAYLDRLFEEQRAMESAATVQELHYPLRTASGTVWRERVLDFDARENCRYCPHLAECHGLVVKRDGFALCEAVLDSEILREVQYAY